MHYFLTFLLYTIFNFWYQELEFNVTLHIYVLYTLYIVVLYYYDTEKILNNVS